MFARYGFISTRTTRTFKPLSAGVAVMISMVCPP